MTLNRNTFGPMRALGRGALAVLLLALIALQPARASEPEVQTIWRLLDYVAVDYPGAVSGGKIISPAEYAEMTEFAAQVETRLKRLPQKTAKPNLVARAATLRQSIAAKSAPATVEEQSRGLARSEERRVGKEWVSPCRSRGSPDQSK